MAENQFPYQQPQGSPPNQPQFAPPEKKSKKKLFGRVGIVVAALGLAGGGAYAVTQSLDSEPEGESTPDAAAEVLFEAIDNDDIIGVTDIMLPSERESFIEPTTALFTELARLEIAGEDTVDDGKLNNFTGLEFEVTEELVFDIEPLGNSEDLHSVTVTEGSMDVTFDAEKFANIAGDRYDELGDAMADAETETETIDFTDEDFSFVVAKEGDDYYASIVYTLAELAREEAGADMPDFDSALVPQGADSKEDVVEQMVLAALDGDLEKAAATLDPAEFRVMYDYWSLFGEEAAEAYKDELEYNENPFEIESISTDVQERDGRNVAVVNGFKGSINDTASGTAIDFESVDGTFTAKGTAEGSDFDVTISDNKLAADIDIEGGNIAFDADIDQEEWTAKGTFSVDAPDDAGTVDGSFDVDIDDLSGNGTLEGTIEGETVEGEAEFSYSNGCLAYDVSSTSSNPDLEISESDSECSDDAESLSSVVNLYKEFSAIFDDMEDLGIVVVERDGKWFVSGVPTYMYMGVDVLKAIDKEELDNLETLWEDIMELDNSSTGALDSVFGSSDEVATFDDFSTTIVSEGDFEAMEDFEEFDFDSPRTTVDFDELLKDLEELEDVPDAMEDATTVTTVRSPVEAA